MKTSKNANRGPAAKRGAIRARIVQAAITQFGQHGYEGATIRKIANEAGCDPALVNYYFGSKQHLFRQCFNLPLDPVQDVLSLLTPGPDGAGERLVRYALTLYDEKVTSEIVQALMRALITDASTGQRFREYIHDSVLVPIRESLDSGPQLAEQIELSMAILHGVATMRYLVKLEPLASMPRDRLVEELAPIIQMRIDRAAYQNRAKKKGDQPSLSSQLKEHLTAADHAD